MKRRGCSTTLKLGWPPSGIEPAGRPSKGDVIVKITAASLRWCEARARCSSCFGSSGRGSTGCRLSSTSFALPSRAAIESIHFRAGSSFLKPVQCRHRPQYRQPSQPEGPFVSCLPLGRTYKVYCKGNPAFSLEVQLLQWTSVSAQVVMNFGLCITVEVD